MCQGFVQQIERSKENLDGSACYRESIGSKAKRLDTFCRGICRGSVELEEKRFFEGGKTHKDECNKQVTQTKIHSTC